MTEWIISCNIKDYDVIGAFEKLNTLNWKQSTNINVGDIVYIYVSKPLSAIKFKTIVTATELTSMRTDDSEFVIDGSNYKNHGRYIELELIETFDDDLLTFEELKNNGLKSIQGPSKVTDDLNKFIFTKTHADQKHNYFFVFQNKSFNEQSSGGYLWAPIRASNGYKLHHYDRLKDIKKGDIIFHSFQQEIIAVSVAQTEAYEIEKPYDDGVYSNWGKRGRAINSDYYFISNPIKTIDFKKELLELQTSEHGPINRVGGGKQGYLYEVNKEMGEFIMDILIGYQTDPIKKKTISKLKLNPNVFFEENKLDIDLIDDLNNMFNDDKTESEPYKPKPQPKSKPTGKKAYHSYPRNKNISLNALKRANHKCEINNEHPSFIRKNTNNIYTEPHHLIPMAYQDVFKYSLDVEANIVSLCSNCHNEIHYGKNTIDLVKKLFDLRKNELSQAGLDVDCEKLIKMY